MSGAGDFLGGALGYIADELKMRRQLQLQDEQDEKRSKRDLDVYEKKKQIDERIAEEEKRRTASTFETDPETGMVTGFNAMGEPVWSRKMGPGVQKKMLAEQRKSEAEASSAQFDAEHKDDIFEMNKSSKEANNTYMSQLGQQAAETTRGQRIKNNALEAALQNGTELPPALRPKKNKDDGPKTSDVATALDDFQARIGEIKKDPNFDPDDPDAASAVNELQNMINDARAMAISNPAEAAQALDVIASRLPPKKTDPKLTVVK